MQDLRETLRFNRIDLAVPPTLPLVQADPRLLHHILINLLANASQHGGGDTPIAVRAVRTADAVELAVEDRGPGLSATGPDLFQSFVRGDSDRSGGSGLGLAIVKSFADAMRVEVLAGAADGGGARIVLRLPVR